MEKEGLVIRELKESDTEYIEEISRYLAERWFATPEKIKEEYLEPSFKDDLPFIIIALVNGKLAGHGFLIIEDGLHGILNKPWITALYVKEEFRNQGIGRKLIEVRENKCREMGFDEVYLDTAQTEGYFRKLGGWEEIGQDFWEKGGKTVTVFRKKL